MGFYHVNDAINKEILRIVLLFNLTLKKNHIQPILTYIFLKNNLIHQPFEFNCLVFLCQSTNTIFIYLN